MTHDNEYLKFSDFIKHLGIYLDSNLSFEKHINQVVSCCYLMLRHISSIRKFISKDSCEQLIHSLISSKLDYCNVLFVGLQKQLLKKLQKCQNAALRIVVRKRKNQSVSADIIEHHWLVALILKT